MSTLLYEGWGRGKHGAIERDGAFAAVPMQTGPCWCGLLLDGEVDADGDGDRSSVEGGGLVAVLIDG